MRLLLDTHVLLWFAEGARLADSTCEAIERAGATDGLAVSAITFWEIAMLADRGRLTLSLPVLQWRKLVLAAPSLVEAPLDGDIGVEAVQLPGRLHADPADRILAATARLRGLRLATSDRRLLDYAAEGHLEALRCRTGSTSRA